MLAASSAGSALVLVVAVVAFFARKRMLRKKRERGQFGALLDRVYKSKLNMTYEVLERATNYCNASNKLEKEVKQKSQPLSWEARLKIILGTAEGLAYLHEESPVRIIRTDIKLSNIMLENDFTPKIADFGLARLFPEDGTHISTTVAGTL